MNRIFAATFSVALLLGCATPVVMLEHPETGQVVRCGGGKTGSMAGGMIGYEMEKDSDEQCVRDYESRGFRRKSG